MTEKNLEMTLDFSEYEIALERICHWSFQNIKLDNLGSEILLLRVITFKK